MGWLLFGLRHKLRSLAKFACTTYLAAYLRNTGHTTSNKPGKSPPFSSRRRWFLCLPHRYRLRSELSWKNVFALSPRWAWQWRGRPRGAGRKINCCKHKQKYNFVASHLHGPHIYGMPARTRYIATQSLDEKRWRAFIYLVNFVYIAHKPNRGNPPPSEGKAKQKAKQPPTPCWMRRGGRWVGVLWEVLWVVPGVVVTIIKALAETQNWGLRTQDPGPGLVYPVFVMLVKHFARGRLTIFRFWYLWVLSLNVCLGDRMGVSGVAGRPTMYTMCHVDYGLIFGIYFSLG